MDKEIQLQINKITIFIVVNIILLVILYNIPIQDNQILNNLCLYKNIFGIKCWNCGMTRACLSVLHLDFSSAFEYNQNVIFVLPLTIIIYLYFWYKFIVKKKNNEKRKRGFRWIMKK